MPAFKDWAWSQVVTPPSPASSGTTLTLTTSSGSFFPAVPFIAVACPIGTEPTAANAEKVLVTAMSGDTVTAMTRAFDGSSARTIVATDQFFWGPTAKTLTDVLDNGVCDGRLTLSSGVPVPTSDVTAATTLYYTPYKGTRLGLYDGTRWFWNATAEISIAVPNVASQMYDVFAYDNAGTTTLELLAWTNDSTRATGLVYQDGVLVKSGATTRRYLGSFRTTTIAGQTEDSKAKRLVWNYANRVNRFMQVLEATDTWTYTTGTWRQANGSAANQIALVVGVAEVDVDVSIHAAATNSGAVTHCGVAVGKDSTTVAAAPWNLVGMSTGGLTFGNPTARIVDAPAAGYHFYAWLEESNATGTTTWYGDNGGGAIGPQSGIVGKVNG